MWKTKAKVYAKRQSNVYILLILILPPQFNKRQGQIMCCLSIVNCWSHKQSHMLLWKVIPNQFKKYFVLHKMDACKIIWTSKEGSLLKWFIDIQRTLLDLCSTPRVFMLKRLTLVQMKIMSCLSLTKISPLF